ncbi:MFRP protein, partial [Mystacornis crossleyi]|nr:MFRP protein [Mystacornis crossleyi]
PRFCGSVPPPTFNSNSNRLRVTFVSDGSVGAQGFSARYRAVPPAESESPSPGHCQGPSLLAGRGENRRGGEGARWSPPPWLLAESCAWDEHL